MGFIVWIQNEAASGGDPNLNKADCAKQHLAYFRQAPFRMILEDWKTFWLLKPSKTIKHLGLDLLSISGPLTVPHRTC